MVATLYRYRDPLRLVVTGQASDWQEALDRIVGPRWLTTQRVCGRRDLLEVVTAREADAAVLDDEADWELDAVQMLRLIRRIDALLPVVLVTGRTDRRVLEDALRLAALSVVVKPLGLEELLRQIYRIMSRLDEMLRQGAQQ